MRTTVLALSIGLVLGSVSAAQAAPDTTTPTASEPQRSVTLITGDRVLLAGGSVVSYLPGPGRRNLVVSTYRDNGHTHVVPGDAAPLIARGKLDRRLFDVTTLVEFGYDDARRGTVPLIVKQASGLCSGRPAACAAGRAAAEGHPAGAHDRGRGVVRRRQDVAPGSGRGQHIRGDPDQGLPRRLRGS
jgi:hypothetical protein